MDFTSRMVALLGELRRERNGAVADAMSLCGAPYGLNYGVSLPTLRQIARAQEPSHEFARYLYRQEVRELRLAALHIAQPECFTRSEAGEWAAGIINSEVAEEAAFALLHRVAVLPELYAVWLRSDNPLLHYAALMAAARSPLADMSWSSPAVGALRRDAGAASGEAGSPDARKARAALLTARGVVALFAALGSRNEENRLAVLRIAGSLGKLPAEDCVHEELAWRLEA